MNDTPSEGLEPLLTIDELSQYLQIPKSTLYVWRTRVPAEGPPGIKVGSALRYERSAVERWLDQYRETSENGELRKSENDTSGRGRGSSIRSITRRSGPRQP